MKCILDAFKDTISKQLKMAKDSKRMERVKELSSLFNEVDEMKKAIKASSGPKTINIGGIEVMYSVTEGTSLAGYSRKTGIRISPGITADKVLEYLYKDATDSKQAEILKVKAEVNKKFEDKYGKKFESIVKNMDEQTVRKFLLLHEYRHSIQDSKRESYVKFMEDYKKDPVSFELDANEWALKQLGLVDKIKTNTNNKQAEEDAERILC